MMTLITVIYTRPLICYAESMSRKAVDAVFAGLFSLTDIRVILRQTAPSHELSGEEKEAVRGALSDLKHQISVIEGELLP